MGATGPGSKFGAEFGDNPPGTSPAPATSPPSDERVKIVLEHNRYIREALKRETDHLETDIAYHYIDGFIRGVEWARGIKESK